MKKHLRSRLTDFIVSSFSLALLAAVFTACQHDPGSFSIDTPGSFEKVTTLTDISGSWDSGSQEGTLTAVRLTLMRYSDNKFWNGTSWGTSFDLPTTVSSGTWQITPGTGLPSGADLQPDYYLIEAYADFTFEPSTHNTLFTVGVPAPPMLPSPWAWGSNGEGRMGVGQSLSLSGGPTPLPVFMRGALEGKIVTGISAGGSHTLAISSEGRLYSWGDDGSGQLGSTEPYDTGGAGLPNNYAPVKVDDTGVLAGKKIHHFSAGQYHSLAASEDGLVFAWGQNQLGRIGQGTTGGVYDVPVAVTGLLTGKHVDAVSAGGGHSVVLTDAGELFAWGMNTAGSLGDGTLVDRNVPVAVTGLGGVVITAVECGGLHTLALSNEGKLYAWGYGAHGQLGRGTTADSSVPVLINGPWGVKKITSISAGENHSLAVDEDGKVYAWGTNGLGQLGLGDQTQRLSPVQVTGALAGQDIHRVEAGYDFSMAQTHDGKVFTWGYDTAGELARPGGSIATTPGEADLTVALSGGRAILGLSAGDVHVEMLTGFTPKPQPEIEVEAQGTVLTDGTGPGIDFGTQSYGSDVVIYVEVRNKGSADLTDLDAWIDGPNAGDFFTFFMQPPVEPNGWTGFYVFFVPNPNANPPPTAHTATLHIQSNDADENTFDIALSGTAYPAAKPETGFQAGTGVQLRSTVTQPDGKILLGGSFTSLQPKGSASPVTMKNMGRLNADGTLDAAFRPDPDNWVHCIAVQHDGKILIGGQFTSLQPGGTGTVHTRNYLARLNADGTVDTGFVANLNGLVRCILPRPNGQILIGGQFTTVDNGGGPADRNRIALLNDNGTPDIAFNPNANGEVLTMAADDSGRLYVAGYFSGIGGATRYNVARLDLDDGTADGFTTVQSAFVYAIAMEVGGRVLMGGDFSVPLPGGGTANNLLRIDPSDSDSLDVYFRPNPGYRVQGISVQTDGGILVSGSFTSIQPFPDLTPTTRNRMVKYHSGGTAEFLFDPNFDGEVFGAAIQADGKIVPAGVFTTVGNPPQALAGTARLSNSAVTDDLMVPSLNEIIWGRSGALPDTNDVRFDLSTDGGATWTPLAGTVFRFFTSWFFTPSTPLPGAGRIRARARTTSGDHNGSSGLVEKIVIFGEPPDIAVLKNGSPIAFGHSHEFGVVGTGSASSSIVLTIQNNGGGPLTGLAGFSLVGSNHFQIIGPASGTVAAGGSTSLTVLFKPRTTGIHSATLSLISNDPDQPFFDILLSGTGSLPVTTWKQVHFGQTENTGNAADTATPAGDGISNLQKYAQNLDPNASTTAPISVTLGTGGPPPPEDNGEAADSPPPGGVFHFNYQRNKLALADIIFQVEWSDTLAGNDWHADDVTEEILSDNGSVQQVKATVPAGTAGRRFVRLKMTRP